MLCSNNECFIEFCPKNERKIIIKYGFIIILNGILIEILFQKSKIGCRANNYYKIDK